MVSDNNSFKTIIYIVRYRESPDVQPQEAKFYTKRAADDFALTVELLGGVAVVYDDEEEGV